VALWLARAGRKGRSVKALPQEDRAFQRGRDFNQCPRSPEAGRRRPSLEQSQHQHSCCASRRHLCPSCGKEKKASLRVPERNQCCSIAAQAGARATAAARCLPGGWGRTSGPVLPPELPLLGISGSRTHRQVTGMLLKMLFWDSLP